MKIFIVLAFRSRSKAAGASSMPAISEVRSATRSSPSVSREITSANSSTYVKQPCTRNSLTRIVSGSRPARPAADYDDGALGPRRRQSAAKARFTAGALKNRVGLQTLERGGVDGRVECAIDL